MRNGYRAPSPAGKGTASAMDRVLSYIVDLRRSPSLSFISLEPYPARFARHLPHMGKALSVVIVFLHVSCIRFDDARKAVFSFRCLPHWGRGTASAVDSVLSLMAYLRRSPPLSFIPLEPYPARSARHLPHAGKALCRGYPAIPIQPPPLRGTSFHRKEGVSTRAPFPWKGLPSAARRGWLSFLRRSRLLFAFPMQGKPCSPCTIIHNQHCPYEGKPKRRRKHPAPL